MQIKVATMDSGGSTLKALKSVRGRICIDLLFPLELLPLSKGKRKSMQIRPLADFKDFKELPPASIVATLICIFYSSKTENKFQCLSNCNLVKKYTAENP